MERVVWHEEKLDTQAELAADGSFEVEGVRYASTTACARILGVREVDLKQAWGEIV
jgi:hypothetical protein